MGCIMNKCRRCNVNIIDDSLMCPLCKGVLEIDPSSMSQAEPSADVEVPDEEVLDGEEVLDDEVTDEDIEDGLDKDINTYKSRSVMYPDVEPAMKKIKFVIKLFVFISFVIECVLILINYLTYNGFKWSVICGAAMIYICASL